jgi:urocanate hydratase
MSGAQPKAGNIAGCITVCAEVNAVAAHKRHQQGWVDELIDNMPSLLSRTKQAIEQQEAVSIAYVGNIVEVWESFYENNIFITLGSDQTSLHNPWSGGYYPAGLSFEAANKMIAESPDVFVKKVKESLVRHVKAINKHTERGTYFFDYGNAFLLESSRAEADIWANHGISFKYPSYVQDILGPCALIMALVLSDGYVPLEKKKIY